MPGRKLEELHLSSIGRSNMMNELEVRNKAVLLKFVRCCINRAYAMTDDSALSAEEKHALEAILGRIRDEEDSWRSPSDLARFIKTDFIAIYEDVLRRLPPDIIKTLFLKAVELCLEVEDLSSIPEIREALDYARKAIIEKYEEVKSKSAEQKSS